MPLVQQQDDDYNDDGDDDNTGDRRLIDTEHAVFA